MNVPAESPSTVTTDDDELSCSADETAAADAAVAARTSAPAWERQRALRAAVSSAGSSLSSGDSDGDLSGSSGDESGDSSSSADSDSDATSSGSDSDQSASGSSATTDSDEEERLHGDEFGDAAPGHPGDAAAGAAPSPDARQLLNASDSAADLKPPTGDGPMDKGLWSPVPKKPARTPSSKGSERAAGVAKPAVDPHAFNAVRLKAMSSAEVLNRFFNRPEEELSQLLRARAQSAGDPALAARGGARQSDEVLNELGIHAKFATDRLPSFGDLPQVLTGSKAESQQHKTWSSAAALLQQHREDDVRRVAHYDAQGLASDDVFARGGTLSPRALGSPLPPLSPVAAAKNSLATMGGGVHSAHRAEEGSELRALRQEERKAKSYLLADMPKVWNGRSERVVEKLMSKLQLYYADDDARHRLALRIARNKRIRERRIRMGKDPRAPIRRRRKRRKRRGKKDRGRRRRSSRHKRAGARSGSPRSRKVPDIVSRNKKLLTAGHFRPDAVHHRVLDTNAKREERSQRARRFVAQNDEIRRAVLIEKLQITEDGDAEAAWEALHGRPTFQSELQRRSNKLKLLMVAIVGVSRMQEWAMRFVNERERRAFEERNHAAFAIQTRYRRRMREMKLMDLRKNVKMQYLARTIIAFSRGNKKQQESARNLAADILYATLHEHLTNPRAGFSKVLWLFHTRLRRAQHMVREFCACTRARLDVLGAKFDDVLVEVYESYLAESLYRLQREQEEQMKEYAAIRERLTVGALDISRLPRGVTRIDQDKLERVLQRRELVGAIEHAERALHGGESVGGSDSEYSDDGTSAEAGISARYRRMSHAHAAARDSHLDSELRSAEDLERAHGETRVIIRGGHFTEPLEIYHPPRGLLGVDLSLVHRSGYVVKIKGGGGKRLSQNVVSLMLGVAHKRRSRIEHIPMSTPEPEPPEAAVPFAFSVSPAASPRGAARPAVYQAGAVQINVPSPRRASNVFAALGEDDQKPPAPTRARGRRSSVFDPSTVGLTESPLEKDDQQPPAPTRARRRSSVFDPSTAGLTESPRAAASRASSPTSNAGSHMRRGSFTAGEQSAALLRHEANFCGGGQRAAMLTYVAAALPRHLRPPRIPRSIKQRVCQKLLHDARREHRDKVYRRYLALKQGAEADVSLVDEDDARAMLSDQHAGAEAVRVRHELRKEAGLQFLRHGVPPLTMFNMVTKSKMRAVVTEAMNEAASLRDIAVQRQNGRGGADNDDRRPSLVHESLADVQASMLGTEELLKRERWRRGGAREQEVDVDDDAWTSVSKQQPPAPADGATASESDRGTPVSPRQELAALAAQGSPASAKMPSTPGTGQSVNSPASTRTADGKSTKASPKHSMGKMSPIRLPPTHDTRGAGSRGTGSSGSPAPMAAAGSSERGGARATDSASNGGDSTERSSEKRSPALLPQPGPRPLQREGSSRSDIGKAARPQPPLAPPHLRNAIRASSFREVKLRGSKEVVRGGAVLGDGSPRRRAITPLKGDLIDASSTVPHTGSPSIAYGSPTAQRRVAVLNRARSSRRPVMGASSSLLLRVRSDTGDALRGKATAKQRSPRASRKAQSEARPAAPATGVTTGRPPLTRPKTPPGAPTKRSANPARRTKTVLRRRSKPGVAARGNARSAQDLGRVRELPSHSSVP